MRKAALVLSLVSMCSVLAASADAATLALATEEKTPPETVSEEIRDALNPTAIVLSDEGEPVWEFWLPKTVELSELPKEGQPSPGLMKKTALLGVVNVHRDQRDYKDDLIEKGLYTLRYAEQPQDGNHMGTAPFPHFALLLPASFDKKLDLGMDHDEMVDESTDSSVAEHPMILSLQPVKDSAETCPALADGVEKTKVVQLEIPAVVAGNETASPLRFALVYEGVGKTQ